MFGKTQRGVSERPNKPQKTIPKWLEMLVAILAILCVVSCSCYGNHGNLFQQKNQVTSDHYQEEDTNKDYRFYDLLPQQQVTQSLNKLYLKPNNKVMSWIIESPKPETTTEDPTNITSN